jgi:hypothetical protein
VTRVANVKEPRAGAASVNQRAAAISTKGSLASARGWVNAARARRAEPSRGVALAGLIAVAVAVMACSKNDNTDLEGAHAPGADPELHPATGGDPGGSAGSGPQPADDSSAEQGSLNTAPPANATPETGGAPWAGVPVPDTAPAELQVDVFGAIGNHYWLDASVQQVGLMNAPFQPSSAGAFEGDVYSPLGPAPITFADHLFVTAAGAQPHTADFGKVQLRLIGQTTGRPWTVHSLPNFKIDSDEFIAENRIGGVKHLRLNNAVTGNIFREKLALDLYRALGYPAPRARHVWVSGSVWGPEVSVPYVAVEAYKPQFCKQRTAELAGGCVNMWELQGDLGGGALGVPTNCQFSECDSTRGLELEAVMASTARGAGYQAALAGWIDWDAFHRFQCLSWILQTGDDALHNSNNLVLVERADGKFQLLPYSVDLSFGQGWPREVRLGGDSSLAAGCQSDSSCWAETIAVCELLVDAYRAADPVGKLEALHGELATAGMLREGDDERYVSLRKRIVDRLTELPVELEANRAGPVGGSCRYPLVQCGEVCVEPEACPPCEPEPDAGSNDTTSGGGQACLP